MTHKGVSTSTLVTHNNVCSLDHLQCFDSEEFNAQNYIESYLVSTTGKSVLHQEENISELIHAIDHIQSSIDSYIAEHHLQLLENLASQRQYNHPSQRRVEMELQRMRTSIELLQTELHEKYAIFEASTEKLRQAHLSIELIEVTAQFMQLFKRMHAMKMNLSGTEDHQVVATTPAMAKVLYELVQLTTHDKTQPLDFIQCQKQGILDTFNTTLARTVDQLLSGIETLNSNEMAKAMQVVFYFEALVPTVDQVESYFLAQLESSIDDLVLQLLPSSKSPLAIDSKSFDASFVQDSLQSKIFDSIELHAFGVWNFQRVLSKLKSTKTDQSYLELIVARAGRSPVVDSYWMQMCHRIKDKLEKYLELESRSSKDMVNQYPWICRQATRVMSHLSCRKKSILSRITLQHQKSSIQSLSSSSSSHDEIRHQQELLDAFEPLFQQYQKRCRDNLIRPVELMFPTSTGFHANVPSLTDMKTFSRVLDAQVSQFFVMLDEEEPQDIASQQEIMELCLVPQVAHVSSIFCTRIEDLLMMPTASSIDVDPFDFPFRLTKTQSHNLSLVYLLTHYLATVTRHFTRSDLDLGLDPAQTIVDQVLRSYFQSLAQSLTRTLAKMHHNSFLNSSTTGGPSTRSKFMTDFSTALNVIQSEHLEPLRQKCIITIVAGAQEKDHQKRPQRWPAIVSECLFTLVQETLVSFVQYASMLRPLEENGKLRLINDMTQFELGFEPVMKMLDFGHEEEEKADFIQHVWDEFRAFKQLVFIESEEIMKMLTSSDLRLLDELRPSIIWHHIISRGPDELELPFHHPQSGVSSVVEYVEWISEQQSSSSRLQTERRIWKEIVHALDAYTQRMSATRVDQSTNLYHDLVSKAGPVLLSRYEVRIEERDIQV